MEPIFFTSGQAFRDWLEEHQDSETEVLVGFYKAKTGKAGLSWSESVDQALCYGWIDGVRKGLDDERYTIRFTPRKPGSVWSDRNIKRAKSLIEQGLMQSAGMKAYERRSENKSRVYSFEQDNVAFPEAYERRFRAHDGAWEFFQSQAPSYQRSATWWVMSAKREATREKRLAELIDESSAGQWVRQFRRRSR